MTGGGVTGFRSGAENFVLLHVTNSGQQVRKSDLRACKPPLKVRASLKSRA